MDITYHYPPDLMALLVDAIPVLCRSKDDVLSFFRGAGIGDRYSADLARRLHQDRKSVGKYEIARTLLGRLNDAGETALRERRELLRRVTEFENFTACWDNDRHKAMALVGEIKKLVNVKDAFTRMQEEAERQRRLRQADADAKAAALRARDERLEAIKKDFYALFGGQDPWRRGKALESVLNRLFKEHEILVREAFTLRGDEGAGVVEQIDGVIEIDGDIYLVEMKWWHERLSPGDVSQHLVRVYHRAAARGIFIANPGFTDAGIAICKEALQRAVFVLCELEELVRVVDRRQELKSMFKAKIRAAQIEKVPLLKVQ